MEDIDNFLARMRDLPLDARLDTIDGAVFDALARRSNSQVSSFAMAMVAMVSLGIGLAGSPPPTEPVAAATVFPLGAPAALAPSTLLGGQE